MLTGNQCGYRNVARPVLGAPISRRSSFSDPVSTFSNWVLVRSPVVDGKKSGPALPSKEGIGHALSSGPKRLFLMTSKRLKLPAMHTSRMRACVRRRNGCGAPPPPVLGSERLYPPRATGVIPSTPRTTTRHPRVCDFPRDDTDPLLASVLKQGL